MSYARRAEVSSDRFPSSENPRRSDNTGNASMMSSPPPSDAYSHGRRWIWRLHRYDAVSRSGRSRRGGTSLRRGRIAMLPSTVNTANTAPMAERAGRLRPTPRSANETHPAAIKPRHLVTSTFEWKTPSRAGNRVIDASSVTATVAAAAIPRPETNPRPTVIIPRRENTTVMPANTTARPAVLSEPAVASSGE